MKSWKHVHILGDVGQNGMHLDTGWLPVLDPLLFFFFSFFFPPRYIVSQGDTRQQPVLFFL